jgi:hypothetical protein
MNTAPIPPEVTEDQIGPLLAEISKIIQAGEDAVPVRNALIHTARYKFRWTQQRIADACPVTQSAVSRALRQVKTPPSRSGEDVEVAIPLNKQQIAAVVAAARPPHRQKKPT